MSIVVPYHEPVLVGTGAIKEPRQILGAPTQNAAWRRGSILRNITSGAVSPAPTGALAAFAGPAASAITIGTSAVAGAPAATYYYQVTYTATGTESQPTQYIVNVNAGFVPTINVASAGAPTGATNYAYYASVEPGYYLLQQGTRTTTALGTTFTTAYPLTNVTGWNQAVTGTSANIVGVALADSNANYFDGTGGSFLAGTAGSRLGPSVNIPPLSPFEAQGVYVLGLGFGQIIEMNYTQAIPWTSNLVGSAVGISLDAATGWFYADPAQTACAQIVGQRDGVYIGPTAPGTVGDFGTRVDVVFYATALAVQ
jgi:hypothetical protein